MLLTILGLSVWVLWPRLLAAKTTVLLMHDPGQRDKAEEAEAALRDLLADLEIRILRQPLYRAARDPNSLDPILVERVRRDGSGLLVWIDHFSSRTMVFTFIGSEGIRVVQREIPPPEAGAHGRYEAIALMIRSGLVATAHLTAGRGQARRGLNDAGALLLSGGYQLQALAPTIEPSHAASIALAMSFYSRWQVALEYAYHRESLIRHEELELHLQPQTIKLSCAFESRTGPIFWGMDLGARLGLWKWRALSSDTNLRIADQTIEKSFCADASLRFGVALFSGVELLTVAGLEVPIGKLGFRMETADRPRVILNLSALRPYVGLLLRFRLAQVGE